MDNVKKLNKWANTHTYLPIDLIRILLGVFLFRKGIEFITTPQYLADLISPIDAFGGGMILIHYIAPAHMIGGIMIVFGLLTRWAIMAQLPILLGAIIVSLTSYTNPQSVLVATVTFIICLIFLLYGGGKNSLDYYLKMEK